MSLFKSCSSASPCAIPALLQTFSDPALFAFHSVPVTQPVDEIITQLNELDRIARATGCPAVLGGRWWEPSDAARESGTPVS